MGRFVLLALSLVTLAATSATRPHIPQKPATLPEFHVPREGSRTLDDEWIYQQTLYDASISNPSEWGALPVAMEFTYNGRGFLGTLHTVFRTLDAGRTWTNLDPSPPPQPSPAFAPLREPYYLNHLAIHPAATSEQTRDSIYLAIFNASLEEGIVRLIRALGPGHYMWPDTQLIANRWLTTLILPDTGTGVALAGLDAEIFRNDSIQTSTSWDTLDYSFGGTWVKEVAQIGNIIFAVGSNQWLSLDRGYSWQILPPADELHGDADISFAPQSTRAIVCGPGDPTQIGFARYTTDLGQTWSPRTMSAPVPMRTALMVNDTLGYVAGGDASQPRGQIWRTNDGGESWELALETDCEFTELAMTRESGAYVNIIAAGFYADFRGAVWRSQLFMPDTGTVIYTDPDTLEFATTVGSTQQLTTVVRNAGTNNVTLTNIPTSSPFSVSCCPVNVLLLPGDTLALTVTYAPTDTGTVTRALRIQNDRGQLLELVVSGTAEASAANPNPELPEELSLSVYPNPGNAEFRISYTLPRASDVELRIFDVNGRAIATLANEMKPAGEHVQSWNASELASGIYFVSLQSAAATRTEKIVLVK
ncbi:T9SS type A sorting domain-containing protein [bacterium]|nr:T9SS type A sorting domain-containing protein [bacterium]